VQRITSRTGTPAQVRPIFVLRLRPEPGLIDPIRNLKALLKTALRRHGLRCLEAVEAREEGQP
jgi:hypothetical protein